jgi:hypothetical protein
LDSIILDLATLYFRLADSLQYLSNLKINFTSDRPTTTMQLLVFVSLISIFSIPTTFAQQGTIYTAGNETFVCETSENSPLISDLQVTVDRLAGSSDYCSEENGSQGSPACTNTGTNGGSKALLCGPGPGKLSGVQCSSLKSVSCPSIVVYCSQVAAGFQTLIDNCPSSDGRVGGLLNLAPALYIQPVSA